MDRPYRYWWRLYKRTEERETAMREERRRRRRREKYQFLRKTVKRWNSAKRKEERRRQRGDQFVMDVLVMGPTPTYVSSDGQNVHSISIDDTESMEEDRPNLLREIGSNAEEDHTNFAREIASWHAGTRQTRLSSRWLIEILNTRFDTDLPYDIRTICRYPTKTNVDKKCDGDYIYMGIETGIARRIYKYPKHFTESVIRFDINIDGLPLFNSKKTQLWPILCNIVNLDDPFLVACYYGPGKPIPIEDYLWDLCLELKDLENKVIRVPNNDNAFELKLNAFICDAPARQMVKCIKGHTGFYCCERCETRGRRVDKTFVFNYQEIPPAYRTGRKFENNEYINPDPRDKEKWHQLKISPLVTHGINVSCVDDFPLDYMHLVCLGVVKRIFTCMLRGKARETYSLNPEKKKNFPG